MGRTPGVRGPLRDIRLWRDTGTDGDVKTGWPVSLAEAGAWFASMAVGDDGTAYGFAIEPAGTGINRCGEKGPVYTGTIVALDAEGTPLYTTTIVVP